LILALGLPVPLFPPMLQTPVLLQLFN
jgi:hypothetical protein